MPPVFNKRYAVVEKVVKSDKTAMEALTVEFKFPPEIVLSFPIGCAASGHWAAGSKQKAKGCNLLAVYC
jgi:hypothetical protein